MGSVNYKSYHNGFSVEYHPINPKTKHREQNTFFLKLKRPDYNYQLKFYDTFTGYPVDMDSMSVNYIQIETNIQDINKLVFVSDDYYSKSSRYITRTTTMMPKIPMIDIFITLIFCPYAVFKQNESNNQYYSFKTINSELEHKFTHLFSSMDIDEINIIRFVLGNVIKGSLIDEKKLLSEKLFKFLDKKRSRIIKKEWWDLYYKRNPYYQNVHIHKSNNMQNDHQINIQNKKVRESNHFLPELVKLNFVEQFKPWTSEGKKQLENDIANIKTMREELQIEFEESKKLIDQDKAHIVCGYENCHAFITYYSYLREYPLIDNETKVIYGFVRILDKVEKNDPKVLNVSITIKLRIPTHKGF